MERGIKWGPIIHTDSKPGLRFLKSSLFFTALSRHANSNGFGSVETTVNQFKCGQNMLLKLDVAATVALWSCNQTKAKCYVISCWLHMLISCKLTRLVYGMEMVHSIGLTNLAHWRDIDRQTVSECFKTTERLSLPIRMPDFSEVGFSRPNMS